MPITKAQQRATAKYQTKNYDSFLVRVDKGEKEAIQSHAAARGESLNSFVSRAIREAAQRDNKIAAQRDNKGAAHQMVDGVAPSNKPILDPCCGGRMFYFDKNNPNVLFCDNREFNGEMCNGRSFTVKPDIIADFTALPFDDEFFYHVVFDPPHTTWAGDTSWVGKTYGRLPKEWQAYIKEGFDECWRVLKPFGTLIFKWNTDQIPVGQLVKAIGREPLYGQRVVRKGNRTHWLCFVKVG